MRRPESSTTILRLQGLGFGFRACHESKLCGVAQSRVLHCFAATAVPGERSLLQKGLGRERERDRERASEDCSRPRPPAKPRASGKGCFGSCCCLHGYRSLGLFQGLCGMG